MRELTYEVKIAIADDDQTDSDAGRDALTDALSRGFSDQQQAFGTEPWPISFTVTHLRGE